MNDLTAAAVERLTAQIADALFGKPGLSLMEIANRRAEIEQMARDAGRLTFCSVHGVFPVRSNGGPGWVMFIAISSNRRESFFGINPREAIDAAMAAMKEQAK